MRHRRGPFWLGSDTDFPPPHLADEQGLLAIGGDLRPRRLLAAYRRGIFPWPLFGDGAPMLWFCPDPRFVLYPKELHIGRTLRRTLRSSDFEVTLDHCFDEVLRACSEAPRPGQEGTWITEELAAAYMTLHHLGFAHSAEAWHEGELVGGLYGVSIGGVFFGESMFARRNDASKIAFVRLVEQLEAWSFGLIDCQIETEHLATFGARAVPRVVFLEQLTELLRQPTRTGSWRFD